jgi:hypothetical protein
VEGPAKVPRAALISLAPRKVMSRRERDPRGAVSGREGLRSETQQRPTTVGRNGERDPIHRGLTGGRAGTRLGLWGPT